MIYLVKTMDPYWICSASPVGGCNIFKVSKRPLREACFESQIYVYKDNTRKEYQLDPCWI